MPKWPRSSGPPRKVLSLASFALSVAVAMMILCSRAVRGPSSGGLLNGLCRLNKAADEVGVFFARAAFDAGRDIDGARTRKPDGFADIAGGEAAGEHEIDAALKAGKRLPVESDAVAAGERFAGERLGVEQDAVGVAGVFERGRHIGRRRDGHRLHHR